MGQCLIRKSIVLIAMISISLLVLACAPKLRQAGGEMDTPEHHEFTGRRLLEEKKYEEARREFELALQLAPHFSRAYIGIALVRANQGDHQGAVESMRNAWKYVKTKDERAALHVAGIRIFTLDGSGKEWLKNARDEYDDAMELDPRSAAACYAMGLAYKKGLEFDQAGGMFRKVLDLQGEYTGQADKEWDLVQKIQRAMPGTITGKKIAILDSINRADVAALFMEELKIDNLYKKRTLKTFDSSFKDPGQAGKIEAVTINPLDISDHPLKADVEGIVSLGVRGLELYPDGSFRPDEPVARAVYALMMEDILIKVTGDNALATRFIGQTSPFPDLRSDLPFFNAAMTVTSRGIMAAADLTTGEFAPLSPVSGADALLAIRKFKEELKF